MKKKKKNRCFLPLRRKLTMYFKTHCSVQKKRLSFIHCHAMVQTSNISVKTKRKDRELGTLPFKYFCREVLTCTYTLLLPFSVASVDKKSFSLGWANTFQAYQEQRLIWQMCQTQLCASSQGRGYSLKSSVRSWETNHAFSFFLVMIWRVFPQPALSSNSLGIQQIQRWHEKGSGYLQPWAPTWTHLLLLMKYFTWPPLVSSVVFWLHVHSILKIQIRSKLGPSGTAAITRVKTPQCDSTHPTKPGGRTRQAEPVCNQVWKPLNKRPLLAKNILV